MPDCMFACSAATTNWNKTVALEAIHEARITSEVELISVIEWAKRQRPRPKIRIAGSKYSYSNVALGGSVGNIILINTSAFNQVKVCVEEQLVIAAPGATLHTINRELMHYGLALETTSALGEETIGGAISTGTHGSGLHVGCIASLCVDLRLVKVDGTVVQLTDKRDVLEFNGACVSVGTLGVFSQVTLRAVPAYFLNKHIRMIPKPEVQHEVHAILGDQDVRLTWFLTPRSKDIKIITRMPADASQKQEGSSCWPDSNGSLLATNPIVDVSYKAMALPPGALKQLQTETEFFVELQHHKELVQQLLDFMDSDSVPAGMEEDVSVFLRYVAGDKLWLSPAFGGDRVACTLVVRGSYEASVNQDVFKQLQLGFENALAKFPTARPHWGKCHSYGCEQLAQLYPMWEAFQHMRLMFDPEGLLLNDHLRDLMEAQNSLSPRGKRQRPT